MQSYIGVTGFKTSEQIKSALEICSFDGTEDCVLMAGVLANHSTIQGVKDKKYPKRHPDAQQIRDIFLDDPNCLNLIHYHCPPELLASNLLVEAKSIGGKNCHGLQLNMCWPDPKILEEFRAHASQNRSRLVLQVGRKAFEAIGNDPAKLSEKLIYEYDGLADYVLLDESQGDGQSINVERMSSYLEELYDQDLHSKFGIVIAGGLSGAAFIDILQLLREFPYLSTDAEGRLHDVFTGEFSPQYTKYYLTMARIHLRPRTKAAQF